MGIKLINGLEVLMTQNSDLIITINRENLCILKKREDAEKVEMDFVKLNDYFASEYKSFLTLSYNKNINIEEVINYGS